MTNPTKTIEDKSQEKLVKQETKHTRTRLKPKPIAESNVKGTNPANIETNQSTLEQAKSI